MNVIKINSSDAQMFCTTQIARHRWVVELFAGEQSAIFFKATASLMSLLLLLLLRKYTYWLLIQLLLVYKYVVGQACLEIQMDRHLSLLARISVTWGQCIQICTLASLLLNSTRLVKIYMMIKCYILNIQLYIYMTALTTNKCFLSEWSCKFQRLAVLGTLIQSKEV